VAGLGEELGVKTCELLLEEAVVYLMQDTHEFWNLLSLSVIDIAIINTSITDGEIVGQATWVMLRLITAESIFQPCQTSYLNSRNINARDIVN
jgi:hypothetical protein